MIERDQAVMILGDLIGFPTVTSLPNLDLIDHVVQILEPLGYELRLTHDPGDHKANLLATIGPGTDGGIVLSGHTDVVPAEEEEWTGAPFVAMRRDQKIFGRGAVDMKGFIACALALAPYFAELPLRRPLHLALTFDEEVGCRGAPILIKDMASAGIRPAAVIVGEPTEMGIVTAHKGMHEYTTTLVGLEGHGSLPAQAVNAVQFGSRYVLRLMELHLMKITGYSPLIRSQMFRLVSIDPGHPRRTSQRVLTPLVRIDVNQIDDASCPSDSSARVP